MTPEEFLAAEIDDRPQQLVDYADQNEIGAAYQAMYWAWREPQGSENWDKAQDFFSKHLGPAIELFNQKNREWAEEQAKAALDESMREAA